MAQIGTPPGVAEGLSDPTERRFRGSAPISDYEIGAPLGEGTFGVVYRATSKRNGRQFALKKILMHNDKEGFPITALREVKLLKLLSHPNILRLEEMAVERQPAEEKSRIGKKRAILYMVTPFMHHDLSGMLTNPSIRFTEAQIKCYMLQLLEGARYLHDAHILHRDIKAANILISNDGILQIADFGLARHYDGRPPQPGHGNGEAVREYTSLVVTRWYRPPELLLTLKRYTPAIDIWGIGCVFGEMFEHKPILEGRTDIDQCVKIFNLVGSPNDESMPGWSELPGCERRKEWEPSRGNIDERFGRKMGPVGLRLLKELLCLDWRKRINAIDALQHEYFTTPPLPARPEQLPRFEESHELDNKRRGNQDRPPAPPKGGDIGMGPEEWSAPANGHQPNGHYNARSSREYGRDRGPTGNYTQQAPLPRYNDRRGPALPAPEPGSRVPAWKQAEQASRAPPSNGMLQRPADLPAKPDIPLRDIPHHGPLPPVARGPDRDRGGPDSYVPQYTGSTRYDNRAPPRESFERGSSREHDPSGREYRDREFRRYNDPDAPPTGRIDPYRDRDRERDRGYVPPRDDRRDERRRTRSRSPERDRERRERLQNRERDLYRR